MNDFPILIIAVVCAAGITDIDTWGKDVCVSMDKRAQSYPEEFRKFSRNEFAKLDDNSGVVVCHAVLPQAIEEVFTDTLFDACGEKGSIGSCIASIEPASNDDYMTDVNKLRRIKQDAAARDDQDVEVPEVSWIVTVMNDFTDSAKEQVARAYSLFIDFLDAQFGFADDIERFVASQHKE